MTRHSDDYWALLTPVLWDGDEKRESTGVIIRGSEITDVVPSDQIPSDMKTSRFDNCTVVPGLIDSHVHLSDWMTPGFLAAGVTTLRDTGNDLNWILERRRRAQEVPGSSPRILFCGPLLDGPRPYWRQIAESHDSADDINRSIEALAAAGVDAIKLYVGLDATLIQAATRAAAKTELPIAAHMGSREGVDLLLAGGGELQHLSGLIDRVDGAPNDEEAITELIAPYTGLSHCPTLVVWDRLARINDGVFVSDSRLNWVHPAILSAWGAFPHRTIDQRERMDRQFALVGMKRAASILHQKESQIVAGSDTPWPYLVPGFSLHDELALLVDAGLTPTDALKSATVSAAEALGISHVAGRVSPGKSADMLVIAGDPTSDIRDLRNVRAVVAMGQMIDPVELAHRARKTFVSPPTDPVSSLIIDTAGRHRS